MSETATPTDRQDEDWPLRLSRDDILFAAENLFDARAARQSLAGDDPHAIALCDAAVSAAEARLDQCLRRRDSVAAGRR